jgi:predicted dienelactone hydrolase
VGLALPSLPQPPTDSRNPGSKIYDHNFVQKDFHCGDRTANVFIPIAKHSGESFPVVVYGHGQALGLDSYKETLVHLAKKGIVAIFPSYDSGFFDQDWTRMGSDYVEQTACAIDKLGGVANRDQVVFSGHSKGAYVAGVAAGVAFQKGMAVKPKAVVLFEAAGADPDSLPAIGPETSMTVVFSDHDTVVGEDLSQTIFQKAGSHHRQFIHMSSYTSQASSELTADHFWPMTQGSLFGGGPESSFHYYGEWKWLGAAAFDLRDGGQFTNPYLYGNQAGDKGIPGFADKIDRTF